jgi:hypothetical protein
MPVPDPRVWRGSRPACHRQISAGCSRPSLIRLRAELFGAAAHVLATPWPPSTALPALTLTGPTGPQ